MRIIMKSNTLLDRIKINFRYGFNIKKPLMILRAFNTYFKALILKTLPLRYVDIAVDFSCNLKCVHCFNNDMKMNKKNRNRPLLTVEEYKKLAKECMKEGAFIFGFQGGELFLRKDWADIIKAFKPSRNIINITTNGTMLDYNKIKELKKMGVDVLIVSLDSGIEEEHDKFRGVKGTYKKALQTIDNALVVGLNVSINTTIYSGNVNSPGIRKLIEMAKNKKIILNLLLASPTGEWTGNYKVMVTDEDIKTISKWFKESPYIRRDVDANFYKWGCSAGNEVLYITPYGDVLPCPFMHFTLGNVKEISLKEIRKKALSYTILTAYVPMCLACEDRMFIEKYISKTFGRNDLPIPIEEVFDK